MTVTLRSWRRHRRRGRRLEQDKILHPAKPPSFIWLVILSLAISSCSPNALQIPYLTPTAGSSTSPQSATATQRFTKPTAIPETINPLTGLAVQDPSLLDLPAALVSISHFPPTARPQAGLSFAPYVFEIYITEGATRFLTAFYGELPAPEVPFTGNCEIRREPFIQTNMILGNRVWLDENKNNIQDAWERGVGGVCVNLYDANDRLLQQTTTDSNGYYGFNVNAGKYFVEFVKPNGTEFVEKNVGDENRDSDVDQATGRSDALDVSSSILDLDAGLLPPLNSPPASDFPPAKVGPVRSGRLVYADIAEFFPGSCLIYAFASSEVLVQLPKCGFVTHDIQGGGYMLQIDEMLRLVNDRRDSNTPLNYTSNIYSSTPPSGGVPASRLDVYIAWLNQSAWVYDPLSQSWWRYVDDADPQTAGIVHPEMDRLTGRQLHFENVIVLFAQHDVVSPTNLNIHLEQDWVGNALLFRDGTMYQIRWSTVASEEEIESGRRKPIRFFEPDDKTLFPLKPGHTWILVVTPETPVTEQSRGEWLLQFHQPPGAK